MSDPVAPARGAIVTYLDTRATGAPFSRGVSCGLGIVDPMTDDVWISVLRPDGGSTLVDSALIMEVGSTPAADRRTSEQD
jgi:hypothetical protein